jgi:hypothetical protein
VNLGPVLFHATILAPAVIQDNYLSAPYAIRGDDRASNYDIFPMLPAPHRPMLKTGDKDVNRSRTNERNVERAVADARRIHRTGTAADQPAGDGSLNPGATSVRGRLGGSEHSGFPDSSGDRQGIHSRGIMAGRNATIENRLRL